MRNLSTESPRFPPQCKSAEGESALSVFLAIRGSSAMDNPLTFGYRLCILQGGDESGRAKLRMRSPSSKIVMIGKSVVVFN